MKTIEFGEEQWVPVAKFSSQNHTFYGTSDFAVLEDKEDNCLFLVMKTTSKKWTIVSWWPPEAIAAIQKLPKVKV